MDNQNSGKRREKRELHLECGMCSDVLRMGMRGGAYLAVASVGLLVGGRFPVEVYVTLRARSRSTAGTGSGLWGGQR